MEPTFLSTAPQRTADYMRAREEKKFGTFQEIDSVLSSQRLIFSLFEPFLLLLYILVIKWTVNHF